MGKSYTTFRIKGTETKMRAKPIPDPWDLTPLLAQAQALDRKPKVNSNSKVNRNYAAENFQCLSKHSIITTSMLPNLPP